jgi:hypothetical protein
MYNKTMHGKSTLPIVCLIILSKRRHVFVEKFPDGSVLALINYRGLLSLGTCASCEKNVGASSQFMCFFSINRPVNLENLLPCWELYFSSDRHDIISLPTPPVYLPVTSIQDECERFRKGCAAIAHSFSCPDMSKAKATRGYRKA